MAQIMRGGLAQGKSDRREISRASAQKPNAADCGFRTLCCRVSNVGYSSGTGGSRIAAGNGGGVDDCRPAPAAKSLLSQLMTRARAPKGH